jgi:hypothetical protein
MYIDVAVFKVYLMLSLSFIMGLTSGPCPSKYARKERCPSYAINSRSADVLMVEVEARFPI